jgi:hypothetical protein
VKKIKRLGRLGLYLIVLLSVAIPTSTFSQPLPLNSGLAQCSKTTMTLTLRRLSHSKHGTFGVLLVNGEKPVYTLEETELEIPPGTYPIELTFSPRFHRQLPLLIVPHRSAIRIHAGNWPRDSSGCILVGTRKGNDMILGSLDALDPLIQQIHSALDAGDSVIIVVS